MNEGPCQEQQKIYEEINILMKEAGKISPGVSSQEKQILQERYRQFIVSTPEAIQKINHTLYHALSQYNHESSESDAVINATLFFLTYKEQVRHESLNETEQLLKLEIFERSSAILSCNDYTDYINSEIPLSKTHEIYVKLFRSVNILNQINVDFVTYVNTCLCPQMVANYQNNPAKTLYEQSMALFERILHPMVIRINLSRLMSIYGDLPRAKKEIQEAQSLLIISNNYIHQIMSAFNPSRDEQERIETSFKNVITINEKFIQQLESLYSQTAEQHFIRQKISGIIVFLTQEIESTLLTLRIKTHEDPCHISSSLEKPQTKNPKLNELVSFNKETEIHIIEKLRASFQWMSEIFFDSVNNSIHFLNTCDDIFRRWDAYFTLAEKTHVPLKTLKSMMEKHEKNYKVAWLQLIVQKKPSEVDRLAQKLVTTLFSQTNPQHPNALNDRTDFIKKYDFLITSPHVIENIAGKIISTINRKTGCFDNELIIHNIHFVLTDFLATHNRAVITDFIKKTGKIYLSIFIEQCKMFTEPDGQQSLYDVCQNIEKKYKETFEKIQRVIKKEWALSLSQAHSGEKKPYHDFQHQWDISSLLINAHYEYARYLAQMGRRLPAELAMKECQNIFSTFSQYQKQIPESFFTTHERHDKETHALKEKINGFTFLKDFKGNEYLDALLTIVNDLTVEKSISDEKTSPPKIFAQKIKNLTEDLENMISPINDILKIKTEKERIKKIKFVFTSDRGAHNINLKIQHCAHFINTHLPKNPMLNKNLAILYDKLHHVFLSAGKIPYALMMAERWDREKALIEKRVQTCLPVTITPLAPEKHVVSVRKPKRKKRKKNLPPPSTTHQNIPIENPEILKATVKPETIASQDGCLRVVSSQACQNTLHEDCISSLKNQLEQLAITDIPVTRNGIELFAPTSPRHGVASCALSTPCQRGLALPLEELKTKETKQNEDTPQEEDLYQYLVPHVAPLRLPREVQGMLTYCRRKNINAWLTGGAIATMILLKEKSQPYDYDMMVQCDEEILKKIFPEAHQTKLKTVFTIIIAGIRVDISCFQGSFQKELVKHTITLGMLLCDAQGKIVDPLKVYSDLTADFLTIINPENLFSNASEILRIGYYALRYNKKIKESDLTWLSKHVDSLKALPLGIYLSALRRVFLRGNAVNSFTWFYTHKLKLVPKLLSKNYSHEKEHYFIDNKPLITYIKAQLTAIDTHYSHGKNNEFEILPNILALLILPIVVHPDRDYHGTQKKIQTAVDNFKHCYMENNLSEAEKTLLNHTLGKKIMDYFDAYCLPTPQYYSPVSQNTPPLLYYYPAPEQYAASPQWIDARRANNHVNARQPVKKWVKKK